VIAGAIAERVMETDYEILMTDLVFRPLGMRDVHWGSPPSPGKVDEPWPHVVVNGNPTPVGDGTIDNPPAMSPAARANVSMADWSRFVMGLMRAAHGDTSVWSASTLHALLEPRVQTAPNESYAYGWFVVVPPGGAAARHALSHDGSNNMNYATAWVFPDAGVAVLVATNVDGDMGHAAAAAVADRVIRLYIGMGR
jgi:CubicO group peptidase (beta-lactamase class C family)